MDGWGEYGDRHVKGCSMCQAAMLFCALEPTARAAEPRKTCDHARDCVGAIINDYLPRDNPGAGYDVDSAILDRIYRDFFRLTPKAVLVDGRDFQRVLGMARIFPDHPPRQPRPVADDILWKLIAAKDDFTGEPTSVDPIDLIQRSLEASLKAIREMRNDPADKAGQDFPKPTELESRILEWWVEKRAAYLTDALEGKGEKPPTQRAVRADIGEAPQTRVQRTLATWRSRVVNRVAVSHADAVIPACADLLLDVKPLKSAEQYKKEDRERARKLKEEGGNQ